MFRSCFVKSLSSGALLSLLTPVYAADKFPDFPLRQASDYSLSAHQDDLTVGLQPVEDVNDQKTYFHTEFSPKGFVPVFVVVHNGSKSESVLFDPSKISCDVGNPSGNMPKAGIKGAATAEVLMMAAIPLGGVVASPAVMEMYAQESHVQQNLILRQVQSQTLSPGASAHGFLYISIPKMSGRGKIQIHIPLVWADSGKESVLTLSF